MTRLREVLTPRRVLSIVAIWVAAFALLSWLDFRPDPVGLAAVIGCVVLGHAAYVSAQPPWLMPLWRAPLRRTRTPQRADGRLRFIRRIIESATEPGPPAQTEHNRRRMQTLLRDVAVRRLSQRPDRPAGEDPLADLATSAPTLHAYLTADPPPRLDHSRIRQLVDRIEDL